METAGAYGGGKAGGAFDPQAFVQRPAVIVRAVCWLFSVIVMGCISAKGWYISKTDGKEYCVYNDDTNACNYGVGISVIAFVASVGFIVGEYLFDQMSSVKTRKHYVLADMGFSAFWAFLYFVGFCYLSNAWGKTETPPVGTANNMQGAIAFCFFSIFAWVACAFFAFQRFRMGADAVFAPAYEVEGGVGSPGSFPAYPGAPDPQPAYSDPPFSQPQSGGNIDYTAPTY
ncbi:synaptogyrin [Maniola jurtina]|uniref:synaptogyrin n=1 Tax=Aphantopus hyperantus TaxID=2795564 RepID=UPI001568F1CB|nr:synaptogyrin [Maniola hyperantus]XP_045772247.1 synaptogyrin [Maniola jurtina]